MARNYKNPAKYRLDFIKENTFNRLWSLRMTRTRVWIVTCAVVAGGAALLWLTMAFTPLRMLLPGALGGDLRGRYMETALRLDSLEQSVRINDAYIANIVSIMKDELPEDSAMALAAEKVLASDSTLIASNAEINFVREYEDEERFNLSVLAPIAAEGMIFSQPVSAAHKVEYVQPGVAIATSSNAPVASVYRGTVISLSTSADGISEIIIQHPNDFVSIYSGLGDVFVSKGKKIAGGQRIAHSDASGRVGFELWHNGSALDPRDYICFK